MGIIVLRLVLMCTALIVSRLVNRLYWRKPLTLDKRTAQNPAVLVAVARTGAIVVVGCGALCAALQAAVEQSVGLPFFIILGAGILGGAMGLMQGINQRNADTAQQS